MIRRLRMGSALRALTYGMVASVLVTSCSLGQDDPSAEGVGVDRAAPALSGRTRITAAVPGGDSEAVRRVLADGVVTKNELADSYDAFIACLSEQGGSGMYAYELAVEPAIALNWNVAGDDDMGTQTDRVDAECRAQHIGRLEDVYRKQGVDIEAGFELARQRAVSCLVENDLADVVGPIEDVSYDEISELVEEAQPRLDHESSRLASGCVFQARRGVWRVFG